jgi:hypothetical protein
MSWLRGVFCPLALLYQQQQQQQQQEEEEEGPPRLQLQQLPRPLQTRLSQQQKASRAGAPMLSRWSLAALLLTWQQQIVVAQTQLVQRPTLLLLPGASSMRGQSGAGRQQGLTSAPLPAGHRGGPARWRSLARQQKQQQQRCQPPAAAPTHSPGFFCMA